VAGSAVLLIACSTRDEVAKCRFFRRTFEAYSFVIAFGPLGIAGLAFTSQRHKLPGLEFLRGSEAKESFNFFALA
jgi:hypothetical protein